jgi:alpha-galactosidase
MTITPAEWTFGNCFVSLNDEGVLTVGNALVERQWRIDEEGRLLPTSLRDRKTRSEWLIGENPSPAPTSSLLLAEEPRHVTLKGRKGKARVVEMPSLTVTLSVTGDTTTTEYRFQVFEDSAGIVLQITAPATAEVSPSVQETSEAPVATGIETADRAASASTVTVGSDMLEALTLAPLHLRLIQVTLLDRTDEHNELASEQEWLFHPSERRLALAGNLFFVEDILANTGLIFLKMAPLPHAQPVRLSPIDLVVLPGTRTLSLNGHGISAEGGAGYLWTTIPYSGGKAGRIAALHTLQNQLRPFEPGRDGRLVSNTWGDRGQDGRVSTEFLSHEILSGAKLGVDVIQIDDGWQKGRTANSVQKGGVWEGFYAAESDFWSPHPERFLGGLAPLVEAAKEKSMRFGLWFAPDSSDDFANWKSDADTILGFYRDLDICYFKIDGVKLRTKTGERNLQLFFDEVLNASEGRVVFDTDVTAETRQGYFGLMGTGPLFVENRYTDWHRYWPHTTLRNVWKLAHYIPPTRLRMEFLNSARNSDKYEGDPLAPFVYRADYLFATVMMTSPLGWFEVQNLPPSYVKEAAPLIAVWKQYRNRIATGTVLPIGEAPDGTSWTGFVSISGDSRTVYALLFRELNDRSGYSLILPTLNTKDKWHVETLAGEGSLTVLPRGRLAVTIPKPQNYVFARMTLDPDTVTTK